MNKYPLLSRFLFFLICPLIVVMIGVYTFFHKGVNDHAIALEVEAISDNVTIQRDPQGVAYIRARHDNDAFFAVGFAHAQDRMWQLEIQRTMLQGRLSEILGIASLEQDIWFRTLSFYQNAEISWQHLSPNAKQSLIAYRDGINAWISANRPLPPEYHLLDIKPQPWHVYDSLAWLQMFSFSLGGNLTNELERLVVGGALDEDHMKDFYDLGKSFNQVASVHETELGPFKKLLGLQFDLEQQFHIGGKFIGSNSWVVAPHKTKTKQTILTNDPHLALQIPSLWYVADIQSENINVSGMTLVGLPIVVFGRNEQIAWGGTNMMADVQDVYIEQVNPENDNQYLRDGVWQNFKSRKEVFHIRKESPAIMNSDIEPIEVRIRFSDLGPVISDAYKSFGQAATLRWTGYEYPDVSYDSFFNLNYATDWQGFNDSLSSHVGPVLNMLYGDVEGNIGFLGIGKIPIRENPNDLGMFPKLATEPNNGWAGHIPFSEMPRIYNPEEGFLASANDEFTYNNYEHFITKDWAPSSRAERIKMLLSAQSQLDISDMQQILSDTVSLPALKLVKKLTSLSAKNEWQAEAIDILANWDGSMSGHSMAASIFHIWSEKAKSLLLSEKLQSNWSELDKKGVLNAAVYNVTLFKLAYLLIDSELNWCDNLKTPVNDSCENIMLDALDATREELISLRGRDRDDWQWGNMLKTEYRHMPFSNTSVLDIIFNREISATGSPDSINVANAIQNNSEGFIQNFGAGFRQVMALSVDKIDHVYMNSTGQSGHPLSPLYDNMIEPFRQVELFTLTEDVANDDEKQTQLIPRSKGRK